MKNNRSFHLSVLVIVFLLAAFAMLYMFVLFLNGDQLTMMKVLPYTASAVFASLMVILFVLFRMDQQFMSEAADRGRTGGVDGSRVLQYINALGEYIFEYDCTKDEMRFSDKYAEAFGSEMLQRGFKDSLERVREIYPADVSRLRAFLSQPGGREQIRQLELRLIFPDGHHEWFLAKTVTIESGGSRKIIGRLINFDKQKKERDLLIEKANTDSLTGLSTRAVMQQKVESFLRYRNTEESGVFYIVDVDNFKDVNDNLGHSMGDLVLKDIAKILRDIFPGETVISRMGGDEYAVFSAADTAAEDIPKKAEYIRSKLHKVYSSKGKERLVTVSVGASVTAGEDSVFDQIYERADKALYLAKIKGKNRFEMFSEDEAAEQVKKYEAFPEWGIF